MFDEGLLGGVELGLRYAEGVVESHDLGLLEKIWLCLHYLLVINMLLLELEAMGVCLGSGRDLLPASVIRLFLAADYVVHILLVLGVDDDWVLPWVLALFGL